MQEAKQDDWRHTELAGSAKVIRFVIAVSLLVLGMLFILHPSSTLNQSWIGWIVSISLLLVGMYEVLLVFRQRLFWSEKGVFVRGVFGNSSLMPWNDLGAISDSMQSRATILTFGRHRHVKIYWSYQAHREIVDIAERKLSKNARTS